VQSQAEGTNIHEQNFSLVNDASERGTLSMMGQISLTGTAARTLSVGCFANAAGVHVQVARLVALKVDALQ